MSHDVLSPDQGFPREDPWEGMKSRSGTHTVPTEQAKQWLDRGLRDRDKLIAFDGPHYWRGLVQSMRATGQKQPITVMRHENPNGSTSHVVWEGNHRVHVADILGMPHVQANFVRPKGEMGEEPIHDAYPEWRNEP